MDDREAKAEFDQWTAQLDAQQPLPVQLSPKSQKKIDSVFAHITRTCALNKTVDALTEQILLALGIYRDRRFGTLITNPCDPGSFERHLALTLDNYMAALLDLEDIDSIDAVLKACFSATDEVYQPIYNGSALCTCSGGESFGVFGQRYHHTNKQAWFCHRTVFERFRDNVFLAFSKKHAIVRAKRAIQ